MTPLTFERIYPYFLSVLAAGAVAVVDFYGYKVSYSDNMLSALISLGGIFAGFLATVKTLLLTISSDVKASLTESGYLKPLLAYLREGIYGSLVLSVVAMAGFNAAMKWQDVHASILYGLLGFAVAALYRISRISVSLLTAKQPDQE